MFADINHEGSINTWHYYSYIRFNDSEWYEFNDSKVGNIEEDLNMAIHIYYFIIKC